MRRRKGRSLALTLAALALPPGALRGKAALRAGWPRSGPTYGVEIPGHSDPANPTTPAERVRSGPSRVVGAVADELVRFRAAATGGVTFSYSISRIFTVLGLPGPSRRLFPYHRSSAVVRNPPSAYAIALAN